MSRRAVLYPVTALMAVRSVPELRPTDPRHRPDGPRFEGTTSNH